MQRVIEQKKIPIKDIFDSGIMLGSIINIVEKYKNGSMAKKLFFGVYKDERDIEEYLIEFEGV